MWSGLDDVTYLSYSFTVGVIYNLCIYTKDLSARKVKLVGFMSGNVKWRFDWWVKNFNIFLSDGKWNKQKKCRMTGEWHQFWHWIISNSQAFPKCKGKQLGQNNLGVQIHSVLCSHCLEVSASEYSNSQASFHNLHFLQKKIWVTEGHHPCRWLKCRTWLNMPKTFVTTVATGRLWGFFVQLTR